MLARIVLLLVAFTAPLAGAGTILIIQAHSHLALTQRERVGLEFTTRNLAVVNALATLRDEARAGADQSAARADVVSALSQLADYERDGGRVLELTDRLAALQRVWALVPADGPAVAPTVQTALETAESLFYFTTERSELNTDTDARTANLIDAYGAQLPTIFARIDRASLALGGPKSSEPRLTATLLGGEAHHAYAIAAMDVAGAAKFDERVREYVEPSILQLGTSLDAFIGAVEETPHPAPENEHTLRDDVARALDAANRAIVGQISDLLEARERSERWALALIEAEAVLSLVVGIGIALQLAITVHRRDREELDRARSDAERLSAELAQQRALEALAVSEAQFRAVFDRSSIGVAILERSGRLIRTNKALRDMFDPIDPARIGAAHPDFRRLLDGEIESFAAELETVGDSGVPVWYEATVSLVRDDAGKPVFALSMLKDVTERKRTDDRLRYQASHDGLSGLPNRAHFISRLNTMFFSGREPTGIPAVCFVDLDEFKFVNDSLGHAIGDRVLVAAAKRLRNSVGPNDLVARFGGDEFAVLVDGRRERGQIERLVERIGHSVAQPLIVDGREIFLTASIGVAVVDNSYRSVEQILRDADTAMYYAKSAGRSRWAFFTASMHDHASRRLEIAMQLRRALERKQFYLAYQPVVSLATRRIEAFETLLRWRHPHLGEISPGEFIPIAEEIGLIVPIGRFVLDNACAQLAAWKASNAPHVARLSVNASVREILHTDYAEYVESAVARHGLAPGELMLEVTESALLASGKFSSGALERIKMAGVGLSIDDFGTGYSSLRYLQQFPFDELKIDRAFVGGSDGNLASEPIVTMLLSLAQALNVGVVAEGVETEAQAARLRTLGCSSAQGYLFGKPAPRQVVEELFRAESTMPTLSEAL